MNKESINSPMVSIITVTYNAELCITETIDSVRKLNYRDFEYIVIDGESRDRTNELVESFSEVVDKHIISPDNGIYDAMNKGINSANGKWIIFMNAGDRFASSTALDELDFENNTTSFIFSDTILEFNDGSYGLEVASIVKRRFNHQSLVYRKSIHDSYGVYLARKGVTISDYLFFAPLMNDENSVKKEKPISIFKIGGVSSGHQHFYQKIAVDIMFGYCKPSKGGIKILIYPVYYLLKTAWDKLMISKKK